MSTEADRRQHRYLSWVLVWRALSTFTLLAGLSAAVLLLLGQASTRVWTLLSAASPLLSGLSIGFCQAARRSHPTGLSAVDWSEDSVTGLQQLWRRHAGELLLGWGLGLAGAATLLTSATDPSYLFSAYPEQAQWVWQDGVWRNSHYGLKLLEDGSFETVARAASAALDRGPGRLAAVLAILPFGIMIPPWVLAPTASLARLWVVVATALLLTTLLHAVAAGRVSQLLLPLACSPLLLHSVLAFRRRRTEPVSGPATKQ